MSARIRIELPFTQGRFIVKLAEGPEDLEKAQYLRYRRFFLDPEIVPPPELVAAHRDFDEYDAQCDHLLVMHQETGLVVGNYRLMPRASADHGRGFYSAKEFDLSRLLANGGLLELGRLCIDPAYREGYIFGLLLRGLAAYVETHHIKYLFGCASQHGTNPAVYARAFKTLYEENLAPEHLRALPLHGHYEPLLRTDGEGVPQEPLEKLLDFYLGVGDEAYVSDVLFVDTAMQCVDLLLVVGAETLLLKVAAHFFRHRQP